MPTVIHHTYSTSYIDFNQKLPNKILINLFQITQVLNAQPDLLKTQHGTKHAQQKISRDLHSIDKAGNADAYCQIKLSNQHRDHHEKVKTHIALGTLHPVWDQVLVQITVQFSCIFY